MSLQRFFYLKGLQNAGSGNSNFGMIGSISDTVLIKNGLGILSCLNDLSKC